MRLFSLNGDFSASLKRIEQVLAFGNRIGRDQIEMTAE
jgi:hypothetical protein